MLSLHQLFSKHFNDRHFNEASVQFFKPLKVDKNGRELSIMEILYPFAMTPKKQPPPFIQTKQKSSSFK
jgi:hypothetical protein